MTSSSTRTPSRVLVLGDSHGTVPMVREALRAAAQLGCARLLSVGDFGIWPGSGGKQFLDTVETMAAARNVDVHVVPGNHDDYDQLAAAPSDDDGWLVLRDRVRAAPRPHRWVWCGTSWAGLGGAASVDGPGGPDGWRQTRGPLDRPADLRDRTGQVVCRPAGYDLGGWWPQERITADDVDRLGDTPVDVLVTHEAPLELPVQAGSHKDVDWPDGTAQRALVSRARHQTVPAVHLCGHWHRHVRHRDETGLVAALSADVAPGQVQWAVVDGTDVSAVLPWGPAAALTAVQRGRLNRRHRIVDDLTAADLRPVT